MAPFGSAFEAATQGGSPQVLDLLLNSIPSEAYLRGERALRVASTANQGDLVGTFLNRPHKVMLTFSHLQSATESAIRNKSNVALKVIMEKSPPHHHSSVCRLLLWYCRLHNRFPVFCARGDSVEPGLVKTSFPR
jgi:hypothetical protein